ncbi:hypothetical protein KKA20_02195, partial [Patescibacteria group bacterium]|nr:hypothetical protein [Patescibacteria group bacterium]
MLKNKIIFKKISVYLRGYLRKSASISKKIILSVLVVAMFFSLNIQAVSAVGPVTVLASIPSVIKTAIEKVWAAVKEAYKKSGSKILNSVARTAMKQMAYDTATWLGSGQKGQKPMWHGDKLGPYLEKVGQNAAGQFIEEVGKAGGWGEKFNLCEPSLDFKVNLGLGLVRQERPKFQQVDCTASEMIKNWGKAGENFRKTFIDPIKNWGELTDEERNKFVYDFLDSTISPTGKAGFTSDSLKDLKNLIEDLNNEDFKASYFRVDELIKTLNEQIKKIEKLNKQIENSSSVAEYKETVKKIKEAFEKIEKTLESLNQKLSQWRQEIAKAKEIESDPTRKDLLFELDKEVLNLEGTMSFLNSKLKYASGTNQKLKDISDSGFLERFQGFFNPRSNQIGQTLSALSQITVEKEKEKEDKEKERRESEGWLDVRNIGGYLKSFPGLAKIESKATTEVVKDSTVWNTGDALIDAANVFLNQLAITAFQKMMRKLAGESEPDNKKSCLDDNSCFDDLEDYEGQDDQGGITDTEERLRDIITPVFSERADY